MSRRFTLSALLLAVLATPALAGPPWIAIELPANPWEPTTRGAFLVVHAYHHGTPLNVPLTGVAEGIVNGERRSVALRFERTARPGVFALRNQWGNAGRWVLVLSVSQGGDSDGSVAQAVVEIAENGAVSAVRVPTRESGQDNIPRKVTRAEIEAALRSGER